MVDEDNIRITRSRTAAVAVSLTDNSDETRTGNLLTDKEIDRLFSEDARTDPKDPADVTSVGRERSGTPIPEPIEFGGQGGSDIDGAQDDQVMPRRMKKTKRYFNVDKDKNLKRLKRGPTGGVAAKVKDSCGKTACQFVNELYPGLCYEFDDVRGPAHEPCFTVKVHHPTFNKDYIAIGGSKKMAKNNVAEKIMKDVLAQAEAEPGSKLSFTVKKSFLKVDPFDKDQVNAFVARARQKKTSKGLIRGAAEHPADMRQIPKQEVQVPVPQPVVTVPQEIDFASDDIEMLVIPMNFDSANQIANYVEPELSQDSMETQPLPIGQSDSQYTEAKILKRLENIKNLEEQACLGLNCIAIPPDHPVYEEAGESGLPHDKTFDIRLTFADKQVLGRGPSKKRAKADAARQMLIQLLGAELFGRYAEKSLNLDTSQQDVVMQSQPASPGKVSEVDAEADAVFHKDDPLRGEYNLGFSNYVHRLVMQKYEDLLKDDSYYIYQKVLAAVVMTRGPSLINTAEVVAVTTGTKCVEGDAMSEKGCAVNDCHAEIIATRCMRDYLYQQLENLCLQGSANSIFEFRKDDTGYPFQLKEGILFHLYISTSPCGDARIFSPKAFDEVNDASAMDSHPNRSNRGLLRAKIEAGEGTIPVANLLATQQTWDSIMSGNALNTMSCSDKVCRWNVLGFQGALLTIYTGPLYYSSVILGSLHHPVHFRRAIYGRIESLAKETLPPSFIVSNPYRLMVSNEEQRRVKKSPNHALTWCQTWENYEILTAAKGRCKDGNKPSRICKRFAFARFLHIRTLMKTSQDLDESLTYAEAKEKSTAFQSVKQLFNSSMKSQGFGKWISKPWEVDNFSLS